MTTFEWPLDGCTPTPLASYLKALGILRLISLSANNVSGKAADSKARGWWENECFHLRTTLSRDVLLAFFCNEYAPSSIIAPWNGRAGFLEGEAVETSNRSGAELMRTIQTSTSHRLKNMRRTIRLLRQNDELGEYNSLRAKTKVLQEELRGLEGDEKRAKDDERKRVEKQSKQIKRSLLPNLRSVTNPDHLSYIDACYVLATDEVPAPLLGSGGNDGSRDFGVNFAEKLKGLFDFDNGAPTDRARAELEAALFDNCHRLDASGSIGQFSPGQAGANATTGYTGTNPLNTWDVVLAMEGTIVFAGALTRRWLAAGDSRAAFPFTFEPTGAGTGSLSPEDPNRPRGEIWTPLWTKPATMSETIAIFAEGRLTLGQRTARTGLDAARSVRRIGLSRGISGFERYSIIQPDGKIPYLAVPLGRFNVPDQPRRDLIGDLEEGGWLERAQRLVSNKKKAPARARQAMRKFADALFHMNNANRTSEGTRQALTALGGFIGWLTTNPKARETLKPPPLLSPHWVQEANDGSAEFRVAAALASLGLPPGRGASVLAEPVPENENATATENESTERSTREMLRASPMAAHFAPIEEESFYHGQRLSVCRAWSAKAAPPTVVWGAGNLVSNMIAVLERRLVDAAIRGLDDKPLAGAMPARLSDVAMFLSGDFDDARCGALLGGLVWAQPCLLPGKWPGNTGPYTEPPFSYNVLKPIFVPDEALRRVDALAVTARMPVPPGLTTRLRAGGNNRDGRATDAAVHIALARARASGLPSPFDPVQSGARRALSDSGRIGAGVRSDRLAAALLIPVSDFALRQLLERAYPNAARR